MGPDDGLLGLTEDEIEKALVIEVGVSVKSKGKGEGKGTQGEL